MVADAPRHRSPNAGWPESAVAAALTYACPARAIMRTLLQRNPWLNKTGVTQAQLIFLALRLYSRLLWVVSLLLLSGAVLVFLAGNGAGV